LYSIGSSEAYASQTSFLKLFGLADHGIAMFESEKIPLAAERVSLRLSSAVDSARDYPPALANTKMDVYKEAFKGSEYFTDLIYSRLCYHLRRQGCDGFSLREVLISEGVELVAGAFYWVASPQGNESTSVQWISRDYEIYHVEKSHFGL
jgi:hypothetical protein